MQTKPVNSSKLFETQERQGHAGIKNNFVETFVDSYWLKLCQFWLCGHHSQTARTHHSACVGQSTSTSFVRAVNFVCLNQKRPESTARPRRHRRCRRRRRRGWPAGPVAPSTALAPRASHWPRRDATRRGAKRPHAWFSLPGGGHIVAAASVYERRLIVINSCTSSTIIHER